MSRNFKTKNGFGAVSYVKGPMIFHYNNIKTFKKRWNRKNTLKNTKYGAKMELNII